MFFLKASTIRDLDKAMIKEDTAVARTLMNRAGAAVAQVIALVDQACHANRAVTFVAGKGNNGGDAFVAARLLYQNGWHVTMLMTHPPAALSNDAREAWNDLHKCGIEHIVWPTPEEWNPAVTTNLPLGGMVVDALLGTGINGVPHGVTAAAIGWINAMRESSLVLAIDIPSGIDGNNGQSDSVVVSADLTVTFVRPKTGFLASAAQPMLGHIVVADIGMDHDLIAAAEADADTAMTMISGAELCALRPPRLYQAHKGTFGHACIISGARGFSGAPALAAMAAMRAGAGLVTAAVPAELVSSVAATVPEAMIHPLAGANGTITAAALQSWSCSLSTFNAVAIGSGMGACADTVSAVQWVMDNYDGPLILDAGALNVLPQITLRLPERLILTPHPGEAARLLAQSVAAIQADRRNAVITLAQRYGGTAVLKGAGTLVCHNGQPPAIMLGGNPGMATAGSGDVLTGITAAMAATTANLPDAARLAVWLHSSAGDFATWRHGADVVLARDITNALEHAFKLLRNPQ